MVPGGRLLISIGYNCNMHKVLYFIVTEDSCIKKSSITSDNRVVVAFQNNGSANAPEASAGGT